MGGYLPIPKPKPKPAPQPPAPKPKPKPAPKPKSEEQPKVPAQMNAPVPDTAPAGPTTTEMDNANIMASKRRGRRGTILTSVTGVDDYPQLSKKTLLG